MSHLAVKLAQYLAGLGIEDDTVLEAVARIPRELFLSQAMQHQAYDNNALPIGYGQTISQPYIVARMTELLELQSDSRVLEIGTGSGYQTAVLAQLVEQVYSVERIKKLQWEAKRRFKQLDIYNVSCRHGDGWQGWQSKGPYDAIIVTAAAAYVPPALVEQLADNGHLIIPVGEEQQTLFKISKINGKLTTEKIEDVRFVPLVEGETA
jgi:protein-L-isoaspartate(D-aspartate) O-methyltransferase